MSSSINAQKTKKIALMGLLFALAIVFSYLESLIPNLGVPGIKLGLSNIVVMYCLFFTGPLAALILAILKAGFVLVTRGAIAALLSAAGGLCSVVVMIIFIKLKTSKGTTSVAGAVFHNIGQLAVASVIIGTAIPLYYLPILVISGVVMGVVTAFILKLVFPAFSKFYGNDIINK